MKASSHKPYIKYKGKTYFAKDLSKVVGIPVKSILKAYSNSINMDDYINHYVKPQIRKTVTIEDITYTCISEACRAYNLNYKKTMGRVENGGSLEEAFNLIPRKNFKSNKASSCKIYAIKNVVNDKVYIGATTQTLFARFCKHKSNPSPKLKKVFKTISKYDFYIELIEECLESNANVREQYWIDFYDSVNVGYNSAKKSAYSGRQYAGKEILHNNILYPSIGVFADRFNLPYFVVHNRLRRGWNVEHLHLPITQTGKRSVKPKIQFVFRLNNKKVVSYDNRHSKSTSSFSRAFMADLCT